MIKDSDFPERTDRKVAALANPLLCMAAVVSLLAGPLSPLNAAPLETSPSVSAEKAVSLPVLHLTAVTDMDPSHADIAMAHYAFGHTNAVTGSKIEHTFLLRNGNATPLPLDRLQPSCGCTSAVVGSGAASPHGMVIAPGQTISVHVSIDPKRLSPGK